MMCKKNLIAPVIFMMALLLGLILSNLAQAAQSKAAHLVSLDWTLTETLVALNAPPIAVAQIDGYHSWIGEPALPDSVVDLGLRSQPNMERLAALAPENILISPMFANLKPRLERIAPVTEVPLYTPDKATWPQLIKLTRKLAQLVNDRDAGEALIENTESRLETLRKRLPKNTESLLVVQFIDARHVRVFGSHSLFQAVLERLELPNAWTRPTNAWGFSLASLEELITIEARLIIVEPYPQGVQVQLAKSGLWQHQPSVTSERVISLPPTWSFGALPSARRFADLLVSALENQP